MEEFLKRKGKFGFCWWRASSSVCVISVCLFSLRPLFCCLTVREVQRGWLLTMMMEKTRLREPLLRRRGSTVAAMGRRSNKSLHSLSSTATACSALAAAATRRTVALY